MVELITEMLIYLAIAALLGLSLGYLIWGWGTAERISEARADGAASARTSVDGSAGLSEQLEEARQQTRRQAEEIDRLHDRLAEAETRLDADNQDDAKAKYPRGSETGEHAAASDTVTDETLAEPPPETYSHQPDLRPQQRADEAPVRDVRERFRTTLREQRAGLEADRSKDRDPTNAEDEGSKSETQELPQSAVITEETEAQSDEASLNLSPVPLPVDSVAEAQTYTEASKGLLSDRPDEVDNLKAIKGVGKVMERVLNEKGIYLFRQLAALDSAGVEWVNTAIEAFPGRIQRDRWVEQAQKLHFEKYGQPYDHDV